MPRDRRVLSLIVLAEVGLALSASAECVPPRLTLTVSSARPRQGQLLAVRVRADAPLRRATLSGGKADFPLEASEDGRAFRGVLGIDLESSTGRRELRVEAEDLCGNLRSVTRAVHIVAGKFPVQRLTVAPEYVEPPESARDRIRAEDERVARVWKEGDPVRGWSGPFARPAAGPARDTFGSRRILNGEPRSPHGGVDIGAPAGAPVTAPAPARVALADDLYFSGGTVILDHGGGLFTSYFHLARVDVKGGDRVAAGAVLGAVGATGRATGPHLHWAARLHGARVNPLLLSQLPRWPLPASGSD